MIQPSDETAAEITLIVSAAAVPMTNVDYTPRWRVAIAPLVV